MATTSSWISEELARAYAEERLGRKLTDGELALDLVGLDRDLAEAKERLTDAIEDEKRRALEDYLKGGPGMIRVTAAMIEVMEQLVEAGRRHAVAEISKLTGREFAELESYSLPRAFYEFHVSQKGSLTGFVTEVTESRVHVVLDADGHDLLLNYARAYEGELIEQARETVRILTEGPRPDPFALIGLPPGAVPGEDELRPENLRQDRPIEPAPRDRTRERPAQEPPEDRLRAMLNAMRVRLQNEAGGVEFADFSRELLDRLDKKIPGARDAASRLVSGLLFRGIGEVYEHNSDLFPCFIYSAVMDAATCAACRTFDGRRYSSWILGERDLPGGGPNPLCLGDGRCRCRLVPCPPGAAFVGGQWVDQFLEPQPGPEPSAMPEIKQALDEFEGLTEDEFRRSQEIRQGHQEEGGLREDLQERVGELRRIGAMIDDEVDRRVWERSDEFEKNRRAFEERVDRSRSNIAKLIREYGDRYERAREEYRKINWTSRTMTDDAERREIHKQVPALAKLYARKEAAQRRHYKLVEEFEQGESNYAVFERNIVLDVLRELRPMGWKLTAKGSAHEATREQSLDLVKDAAKFYPRDWVQASNKRNQLRVDYTSLRGHYTDDVREGGEGVVDLRRDPDLWESRIRVSPRKTKTEEPDGYTVALHELGHRMEAVVPEIKVWEWAWLWSRTLGSSDPDDWTFDALRDLRPGVGYNDWEWAYPDKFANPYIGKIYEGGTPRSYYEIFTMGMEAIFTHANEAASTETGGGDVDLRNFILGLLATIPAPGSSSARSGIADPRGSSEEPDFILDPNGVAFETAYLTTLDQEHRDVLRDRLTIHDGTTPSRHFRDLQRIPVPLLEQLVAAGVTWQVGDRPLPEFDGFEDLWGQQPRGWSEGSTWNDVAGGYDGGQNVVAAGTGEHGSASLLLHETGHAVGQALGFQDAPEMREHHKRLYDKLDPYEQQGGPGGRAGRQELFAESFATLLGGDPDGYSRRRAAVVRATDEEYVAWLEGVLGLAS